ncbi:oxidoreductase [Histoplasma ohiense]|nr:oxidoreductase [Histoplasma ohiense (nom. inval.)]
MHEYDGALNLSREAGQDTSSCYSRFIALLLGRHIGKINFFRSRMTAITNLGSNLMCFRKSVCKSRSQCRLIYES